MKNWKYIEGAEGIKIGNEKAISSTFHINDYGVEVGKWSWDWQGKAPDEKKQNEIAHKIKSYVQQINKNVPAGDSDERDEVFSKLDKFVRSQGLNKKIGNIKDDAKAKELYKKMMDAKEIAEEWGRASNYQKKDNLEGGRKAAEDAYRKAKKEYEDYAMNSKTGNKNLDWDVGNIDWDVGIFNGQWYITRNGQKLKGPFRSMKEAERYLDGHKWELQDKYGNKKTGNETLHEYATSKPRVINEEKTGAEEFFKKLSDDVNEREKNDDKEIKLVGNETYQHKLYPNKYVIIEGNNYKIVTDGKVEKSGVLTDAVLYGINQTYKRVGNSKVGNVQYHKVGKITIKLEANDDDWTVYDTNGHELKSGKGGLGRAKTWAEHFARFTNKRTGNSASNDKFAYVMREFDEGKLKTPDGKVVTDPAQAKAIAYSESKKTENGLARARKAMNADSVIKYKGFTIKYRPFSGKYYISSGPNDTYVGKYAYKEYSSEQDAKDAIDGLK